MIQPKTVIGFSICAMLFAAGFVVGDRYRQTADTVAQASQGRSFKLVLHMIEPPSRTQHSARVPS